MFGRFKEKNKSCELCHIEFKTNNKQETLCTYCQANCDRYNIENLIERQLEVIPLLKDKKPMLDLVDNLWTVIGKLNEKVKMLEKDLDDIDMQLTELKSKKKKS